MTSVSYVSASQSKTALDHIFERLVIDLFHDSCRIVDFNTSGLHFSKAMTVGLQNFNTSKGTLSIFFT